MLTAPEPSDDPAGDADRSGAIGLTSRFLLAVGQEVADQTLSPLVLARALVRVLPVAAAGLSTMTDGLRIPLGASNDAAKKAEELQTSLGDGPCLAATEARATVVADLAELETRWPHYAAELVLTTPFRATASLPLSAPGGGVFAALDLYSVEPHFSEKLHLEQVHEAADTAAALLATCMASIRDVDTPDTGPDWYRLASGRRQGVWVAAGMVMGTRALPARDALSVLRARAYSQHRSLDDLAVDIVRGQLPVRDLVD